MTMVRNRSVSQRFTRAAATYDAHAAMQETVAQALIEQCNGVDAPSRILEVGCGTGLLTARLLERYPLARLDVVDVADGMIGAARDRFGTCSNVRFFARDIRAFRAAGYPLVVSSSSLQWVTPFEEAAASVSRLLARGGLFVGAVMVRGTLCELHEARKQVVPWKRAPVTLAAGADVLDWLGAAGLVVQHSAVRRLQERHVSGRAFLRSLHLRGLTGGARCARDALTRGEMLELVQTYDERYPHEEGGVRATYEVLEVTACKTIQQGAAVDRGYCQKLYKNEESVDDVGDPPSRCACYGEARENG